MAYARFSNDSDIYLWWGGSKECYNLWHSNDEFTFDEPYELIKELIRLKRKGLKIPDHCLEEIFDDIWEEWRDPTPDEEQNT